MSASLIFPLDAWLEQRPLAETRRSRFAALALAS